LSIHELLQTGSLSEKIIARGYPDSRVGPRTAFEDLLRFAESQLQNGCAPWAEEIFEKARLGDMEGVVACCEQESRKRLREGKPGGVGLREILVTLGD
jgi:hypothetical protein